MSVNTKMTAVADEIRVLSGTTDPMGLDAMVTNVGTANTQITTQDELLSQTITTLKTKVMATNATYTVYVGTTEPTSDIGNDGDIYVIREAGA